MNLPDGVSATRIQTDRLDTFVLQSGPEDGIPLLLVHGNVSSSRFYAELMARLPDGIRAIAPDLRGYGDSEPAPIDATRGVRDFADDLGALLDTLGLGTKDAPVHVIGWSVGGGVVMQLAMDRPDGIASLTLEAPMSPYGFGGTKGLDGELCHDDGAGAGGGLANPDFVRRLRERDTSDEAETSPRNIFRAFYVAPGFTIDPALEDAYVQSMVAIQVDDTHYPGDAKPSTHWPMAAPGTRGTNNAVSGLYADTSGIVDIDPKPPVLWIHGANDLIVGDNSMFDAGALGQLGAIPGWPGEEVIPPQPMIGQTRAVLERYAANGGRFEEVVFENCGHSPHLEHEDRFLELLLAHIGGR